MNNLKRVANELIEFVDFNLISTDANGRNALSYACENGMTEIVMKIIRKDKRAANSSDLFGRTPLFFASQKGMIDVEIKLLKITKVKLNPNSIDSFGKTPLMYACKKGISELAIELIKTGDCLPNQLDFHNNSALLYATQSKLYNVIIELLKIIDLNLITLPNKKDTNALSILASHKSTPILKIVWKIITNVNEKNCEKIINNLIKFKKTVYTLHILRNNIKYKKLNQVDVMRDTCKMLYN